MQILKKIITASYVLVLLTMAAATIVERYHGTDFAHSRIYGAWWFSALWAILAATGIAFIIKRKVRRASTLALHLSLVIILLGAGVTHIWGERGAMHLRKGVVEDGYYIDKGEDGVERRTLPFALRLDEFGVKYHEGTSAASDYESRFTVFDGDKRQEGGVSMNNIFSYRSFRFYQSSYDEDMAGSILAINSDPWGIPITYTGYALLFLSLVWMLIDPEGPYRRLLRNASAKRGLMAIALAAGLWTNGQAAPVLPKEVAEEFGKLYILYNDRICPMQTYALDFTKKLCGDTSYEGCTAEQVLTGFIFWRKEWNAEPVIKVKGGPLRSELGLGGHASVDDFLSGGGYSLGPYVREYSRGKRDKLHKQAASIDDRLMLIMELERGVPLKVFPCSAEGDTKWYSPTEKLDTTAVPSDERLYISGVFSLLYEEILSGDMSSTGEIIGKMAAYQLKNGGESLPGGFRTKAERAYNAVPVPTILFMMNLTLGFLSLLLTVFCLVAKAGRQPRVVRIVETALMGASAAALTMYLALRWMVSGNIPMSNGYETMLTVAWLIMVCSLLLCRRYGIVLTFGFLMSGFALLVSHINQMDPQISHLMPVLDSPLLSIHVSVIMVSFALLSLTFICGVAALLLRLVRGGSAAGLEEQLDALATLSKTFLYPAMTTLGIGIFVGAIWANISWGSYWSWDSKEVWALIVFMVYAIPLHERSIRWLRRPLPFHIFAVAAFLTVLMTYFGVNYLLTGMHSYA